MENQLTGGKHGLHFFSSKSNEKQISNNRKIHGKISTGNKNEKKKKGKK